MAALIMPPIPTTTTTTIAPRRCRCSWDYPTTFKSPTSTIGPSSVLRLRHSVTLRYSSSLDDGDDIVGGNDSMNTNSDSNTIPCLHVVQWDSDQDENELQELMEKTRDHTAVVDYDYWSNSGRSSSSTSSTPLDGSQSSSSSTSTTTKQQEAFQRKRKVGLPIGSGATSDGLRFSIARDNDSNDDKNTERQGVVNDEDYVQVLPIVAARRGARSQLNSRWYVTIGNSTTDPLLLLPLNNTSLSSPSSSSPAANISVSTLMVNNEDAAKRAAAELAFQIQDHDDEMDESSSDDKQLLSHEEHKIRQLASLLGVSIVSARNMIRRVGGSTVASSSIRTLSQKCIDMSLLLQCTPSKFSKLVCNCPTLLTFRVETIETKLLQLDKLFSGRTVNDVNDEAMMIHDTSAIGMDDVATFRRWNDTSSELVSSAGHHDDEAIETRRRPPITTTLPCGNNQTSNDDGEDVSESTLNIVRRVPQLLVGNVTGTLSKRAQALRSLLFPQQGRPAARTAATANEVDAFIRVLKRCPELLLYNIEETIAPKLLHLDSLVSSSGSGSVFVQQIRQAISGTRLGTDIALREPRLLLYDINKSLAVKVQVWKARIEDEGAFTSLLSQYPTLLMYSLGAAARLDYFAYRNKRKPDASEARQLLMLSKKVVESWGVHRDECLFDSTPALLDGTVSRRGRPRKGESAFDASKRRDSRRAAQSCSPQQLEELKVGELRHLLKENGGTPSSKRKSELISELRGLGLDCREEVQSTHDPRMLIAPSDRTSPSSKCGTEYSLSYRQWMTKALGTFEPEFVESSDDSNVSSQTAGELEKLYGATLKAIDCRGEQKK